MHSKRAGCGRIALPQWFSDARDVCDVRDVREVRNLRDRRDRRDMRDMRDVRPGDLVTDSCTRLMSAPSRPDRARSALRHREPGVPRDAWMG
jgi:hypothetical protein